MWCQHHGGGIGMGLMAMTLAPQLLGALSIVINVKGNQRGYWYAIEILLSHSLQQNGILVVQCTHCFWINQGKKWSIVQMRSTCYEKLPRNYHERLGGSANHQAIHIHNRQQQWQ